MKLYLIHCGFYEQEISRGVYEFHVNLPVAASSIEEAKKKPWRLSCLERFLEKDELYLSTLAL